MRGLRAHAKQAKQLCAARAVRAIQAPAIVHPLDAAARSAAHYLAQARPMLFLDLYGIPRAHADTVTPYLPKALRTVAATVAEWQRLAYDRRVLARMTMRQLEDLQLSWPDDIRHIKAHS
jgi:uncharacterized protein YjiS (DUF1127 family)